MTTTVGDLLGEALGAWQDACGGALDGHARRGEVHAWRVATRRLVAVAELGLAPRARRHIERAVRGAWRASGRLRDTQVAIALAPGVTRGAPSAAALTAWLRHRLPRQRRRVLRRLRELDRRGVRCVVERELGRSRARHDDLHAIALQRCDAALHAVRERRSVLTLRSPPAALHRLRVAVKRARYVSEAVAQLPGGTRHATAARRLARQQRALGAIADLRVVEEQLADFAARHPRRAVGTAGLRRELRRRQRALAREALRRHPVDAGGARRRAASA